jgi:hypothetical protein
VTNLSGVTDPAARDRLTRVITGVAGLEVKAGRSSRLCA